VPVAPTLSAVIVTVPPVEPVVAAHRARYDRAARWGVPAHVTVLYPFVPPSRIDTQVLAGLASAVAAVPGFRVTFGKAAWFGTEVLWLAPEPADPFVALTAAVAAAFPAYPPYGGAHDEVIPHLTVGYDASEARLRDAEADVLPRLPVSADISDVALWCGTDAPDTWREVRTFPLGTRPTPVTAGPVP
jgi:2'-5' RNA ligase